MIPHKQRDEWMERAASCDSTSQVTMVSISSRSIRQRNLIIFALIGDLPDLPNCNGRLWSTFWKQTFREPYRAYIFGKLRRDAYSL